MRLQVVRGKMVLACGGEYQPGQQWRAIAIAPAPESIIRPVWHVDGSEWYPDVGYQVVLPGDYVISATTGANNVVVSRVEATMAVYERPGIRAEELFEAFPPHAVVAVTEWLKAVGDSGDNVPPVVTGGRNSASLAHERANLARRVFAGAPDALVEQIAVANASSEAFCNRDWESTDETFPSSLEEGFTWVVWKWLGCVEVHDLYAARPRFIPCDAVRIARIRFHGRAVSWTLYNRTAE